MWFLGKGFKAEMTSGGQKLTILNITVMQMHFLFLAYIFNISTNRQNVSTLIIISSTNNRNNKV